MIGKVFRYICMFEGVWDESCGRWMRYEDWIGVSRQSGCKKYDMRSVWSIAGFESGWTKNVPRCTKSTKCTRFGTWMFRILELISGILWIEFLSLDDGFFGSLEFEKWYVEKIYPNFKYLRIFFCLQDKHLTWELNPDLPLERRLC